jgi:hypothetical protein
MEDDKFVIVRAGAAGVHTGYLVSQGGNAVTLREARRVWRWRGARTLHEMALRGCAEEWTRISEPVAEIVVTAPALEVLTCTLEAANNLRRARWGA